MVENTYSDNIMRNIGFLLANKHLHQVFNQLIVTGQSKEAVRNACSNFSRLRWTKKVEPYKSITFTLSKETDLFFASYKNQEWSQQSHDPAEIVKNRYL